MPEQNRSQEEEILEVLHSVRRRLGRLALAVILMIVAVVVSTAAIFGQLVNWFGGGTSMLGGLCVGAVVGFALGFLAGRRT